MKIIKLWIGVGFVAVSMLALSGCNSDGFSGQGSLNLNITDAPVDNAVSVIVAFTGVTLKPQDGSAYDIDFKDDNGTPVVKTIDLLNQQGANSEPLLVNHSLAAGHYNWMRLKVNAQAGVMDSTITLDANGGQHSLYIPSGNQTGLKLNRGFDITEGEAVTFTIDFDVRRSVVAPQNNATDYKLKPTLRIVENAEVGHLTGHIGDVSINDTLCVNTDYSVYIYSGSVVPDDIDGISPDPVSTSLVSNEFNYSIGFLPAGDYTIVMTCQAADDGVDTDEVIDFIGASAVTITAGALASHDFP